VLYFNPDISGAWNIVSTISAGLAFADALQL